MQNLRTDEPREEIVERMGWPEYNAYPAMRCSALKQGTKSMKHVRSAVMTPREDTDAMAWGRLVHCLLTEPKAVTEQWVPCDCGGRGTKKCARAMEEAGGKEVIRETGALSLESALIACDAWLSEPTIQSLLLRAKPEVSGFIGEFGVQCKFRADAVKENRLIDFKTTREIEMEKFERQFIRLGYDIQLGLYERWLRRLLGYKAPMEVHVVCLENQPPFDVADRMVPEPVREFGERRGLRLLEQVRRCMDADHWPGVGDGAVCVPEWAMDEGEDDGIDWGDAL